ncbi:MAG TPA: hypothetical protein VIR38_01180, partial [Thalassobaculum sp.]
LLQRNQPARQRPDHVDRAAACPTVERQRVAAGLRHKEDLHRDPAAGGRLHLLLHGSRRSVRASRQAARNGGAYKCCIEPKNHDNTV